MEKAKKDTVTEEVVTPEQELEKKIAYHQRCIEKLEAKRAELQKPTRKQINSLLSQVEGMTMAEIAEKLGVPLA